LESPGSDLVGDEPIGQAIGYPAPLQISVASHDKLLEGLGPVVLKVSDHLVQLSLRDVDDLEQIGAKIGTHRGRGCGH
tara:strand:- start:253 stop:486 length:234 start_codon:yes stop_codon:yes gene_type:complete